MFSAVRAVEEGTPFGTSQSVQRPVGINIRTGEHMAGWGPEKEKNMSVMQKLKKASARTVCMYANLRVLVCDVIIC